MPLIDFTLTRGDDDIDLEIDYTVAPYHPAVVGGPPECCSPADGGEIEDLAIFGPDGREFTVNAAELNRIESHIYETHDYRE